MDRESVDVIHEIMNYVIIESGMRVSENSEVKIIELSYEERWDTHEMNLIDQFIFKLKQLFAYIHLEMTLLRFKPLFLGEVVELASFKVGF